MMIAIITLLFNIDFLSSTISYLMHILYIEDLERFSKALNLSERGKVYVKGMFEGSDPVEAEAAAVSLPVE